MKSGGLFGAWAHSCRSKLRGRQFLMYWDTSLSRHFMTTDISAIGLYSFRLLMACLSGTGIGNVSRKDWKDWLKPLIVGEHKLQPQVQDRMQQLFLHLTAHASLYIHSSEISKRLWGDSQNHKLTWFNSKYQQLTGESRFWSFLEEGKWEMP